jgi:serine/arginine repetitive matrix protein 2
VRRRLLLRCVPSDPSNPISWLTEPTLLQLGNVINGPGPIDDDDDDDEEEQPLNVPPRMSMAMGMGMGMNPNQNIPFPTTVSPMGLQQGQWGASAAAPFGNSLDHLSMRNVLNAGSGASMDMAAGMNMGVGVGMVDPRVLVAHQQAMLIAKQTYQLAVAQQAMRDAADEWERGSAISGWGGGQSSIGMGMGLNMGMNMNVGSMGAGSFPGARGSLAIPNTGGMGWSIGRMANFPGSPVRPMFAGGLYAASDYGGGSDRGGVAGWTTNSVYGESFGAPRDRSSRVGRQNQAQQTPSPGNGASSAPAAKREGARLRTRTAPSSGGGAGQRSSIPGGKKRGEGYGLVGAVSPPSSWKGPQ